MKTGISTLFLAFLCSCQLWIGLEGLDQDKDGYEVGPDCDDGDPSVHPAAQETCNLIDDDCDGIVDGSQAMGALVWYRDQDGDGVGITVDQAKACDSVEGYTEVSGDCDDEDDTVYPGAPELCGDGVFNDCEGENDADCGLALEDMRLMRQTPCWRGRAVVAWDGAWLA